MASVNISVDKDLEKAGGEVGLSASDLHAAGFQYAAQYGENWRERLLADIQGRKDAAAVAALPPPPVSRRRKKGQAT